MNAAGPEQYQATGSRMAWSQVRKGTLENGSFLATHRVELEHHAFHGVQAGIGHRDETLKVV